MNPAVKIEVTAGVLAGMTAAQFQALQERVLAKGCWEHQVEPVRLTGSLYVGVEVGGMFLGIEPDGYVHS